MPRISKHPEERRAELVDVAERLFDEQGYERTAVSDIVRHIGVAQGTFYYHFKSKAEVLDAVVERIAERLTREVGAIADRQESDPGERLTQMGLSLLRAAAEHKALVDLLSREGNEVLHDRARVQITARLTPMLSKTIEAGVAAGRFAVPFPAEAAEVLLSTLTVLTRQGQSVADLDRRHRLLATIALVFTRVLGLDRD